MVGLLGTAAVEAQEPKEAREGRQPGPRSSGGPKSVLLKRRARNQAAEQSMAAQ